MTAHTQTSPIMGSGTPRAVTLDGQVNRDRQPPRWGAVLGCIPPSRSPCASTVLAQLSDRFRLPLGPRAAAELLANAHAQLGHYRQALRLTQDTFDRRRRVLSDDHPDTLMSANYVAINLTLLGDHEQARHLHEDTLERRRRVLGDDHPDTLESTGNLANLMRSPGEHEQTRRLDQDTLTRRSAARRERPDSLTDPDRAGPSGDNGL